MEVGVIYFNLARLTGVVYCGSLLPLMASNLSNGAHLLSFHPPSLHWWGWRNMKKHKTPHHLFVWNFSDAPLFGFGEDGCAVCVCVRVCPFVGLGAHFSTKMDGATKSLRQAECMVSACNIRLSSTCVCVCVTERRGRRLWQSPNSQLIATPDAVRSLLSYRLGKSNKRAEKRGSHDIIVQC